MRLTFVILIRQIIELGMILLPEYDNLRIFQIFTTREKILDSLSVGFLDCPFSLGPLIVVQLTLQISPFGQCNALSVGFFYVINICFYSESYHREGIITEISMRAGVRHSISQKTWFRQNEKNDPNLPSFGGLPQITHKIQRVGYSNGLRIPLAI